MENIRHHRRQYYTAATRFEYITTSNDAAGDGDGDGDGDGGDNSDDGDGVVT